MRHSRLHANPTGRPSLVLLDLNYSLVANSSGTMWRRLYDRETYREWLVDVLRASGARVALVTGRPTLFAEATLRRIADLLGGWQPDEAHFNDRGWQANQWKQHVLATRILPRFGEAPMLAIESNAHVHRGYDAGGVPWVKIEPNDCWSALPAWTVQRTATLF